MKNLGVLRCRRLVMQRLLFPYHIGTALVSNPNLMNSPSIHVDPLSHTVGNPLRGLIPRIRDGQLALEDEVGSQAIVRMRAIMSVARSRTTRLH